MSAVFHDLEQGSDPWRALRAGMPTCSEFQSLLAKGEGKTRATYMRRLASEIIIGKPVDTYETADMIRGREMEPEARALYSFITDADLTSVGFVTNGPVGCSPDSLIDTSGILEVKTKKPELLIDVLLKDEFPPEHKAQCQGALWVCEREWVDIAVYWPGLPLFIKRAGRDEAYIRNLASEVERFNADLAQMVERVRAYQPRREMPLMDALTQSIALEASP
jgi:hypothetical protein